MVFSRAIRATIGYPSKVGVAIAMASPGAVNACNTCSITPVAPAPSTTNSAGTPMCSAITPRNRSGRNSGYRLAVHTERISAARTPGSGGKGFSLSDKANGSTASGSASPMPPSAGRGTVSIRPARPSAPRRRRRNRRRARTPPS
ncbi:hypothetical protein MAHJHV53_00640 [Mycobacterium avium subsp. hominissuis]|nr:hypothetical protein MAH_3829 [Mycobacterium avium subsp. hominissuis TH135]